MRRNLPKWAANLPKAAKDHLRSWMSPGGWWQLGKSGGKLNRGQNALMAAGLMVVDPDDAGKVRLAGKAAAMKQL